jgi:hypothetical protein
LKSAELSRTTVVFMIKTSNFKAFSMEYRNIPHFLLHSFCLRKLKKLPKALVMMVVDFAVKAMKFSMKAP